jgi:formiminotetrahydrofolate cyclodeaminase
VADERYLDRSLTAFLDALAARERAPGGGSAAALTVAFAAGLVAMVARSSRDVWDDAPGIAAQALTLQDRAGSLTHSDAKAWDDALAALRAAADPTESDGNGAHGDGDLDLERKLERAAAIPLEIAELGADTAVLAAHAGEHGDLAYRADAAAAAALAAGGARAAAHLVEVNLAIRPGDERLARARASEVAATEAAERLLASIR